MKKHNFKGVYFSQYCDKICVYDEHPLAGGDIQYRAPDSRSSCLCVGYLLRILQYHVNTTYNTRCMCVWCVDEVRVCVMLEVHGNGLAFYLNFFKFKLNMS